MTEQPMVSPWSALVVTIVPLRDGRQQLHSSDVRHHDLGKPEISPLTKLWKDPPCYQWVNTLYMYIMNLDKLLQFNHLVLGVSQLASHSHRFELV